jgi:hypothetical protein
MASLLLKNLKFTYAYKTWHVIYQKINSPSVQWLNILLFLCIFWDSYFWDKQMVLKRDSHMPDDRNDDPLDGIYYLLDKNNAKDTTN